MTALNMFVQPKARAGYIIADTAVTDFEGRLVETSGKVAINTGRFPFAIGISGNVHPVTVATAIGNAGLTSLKQLIKHLPAIISRAIQEGAAIKGVDAADLAILLKGVAWDFKAKRPIGFVIASDGNLLEGAEPFTFYETDWNITRCDGSASPAEMLGRVVDICDPASFDPTEDGRALIIHQYQQGAAVLLPGLEGSTPFRIGGMADLVEVTKKGVKVWGIHDFGDTIGQHISPRAEATAP